MAIINFLLLLVLEVNASEAQQEMSICPFRLPDASLAE